MKYYILITLLLIFSYFSLSNEVTIEPANAVSQAPQDLNQPIYGMATPTKITVGKKYGDSADTPNIRKVDALESYCIEQPTSYDGYEKKCLYILIKNDDNKGVKK